MLDILHIENIAVIECAEITFNKGFNVLTGETGAGKSIVIDAIGAVLGERAYRDMIRTGATKASVRAVFSEVPQFEWFSENDVPYDREVVIQREIYLDGRNICRVNGVPVSVGILRKLGVQLINIHGQHDSATLFDEENHLRYLDAFADHDELIDMYLENYKQYISLQKEIARISMDEGEKLRRLETLRYQIEEIQKADLKPGEDEELETRRKILQNAEKLSDGMHFAVNCLYGDDDSDGAAVMMEQAERELTKLSRYTEAYDELRARLTDLVYQVRDITEEIKDATDDLMYSSDELERIESRLDVIHKLRRKYGATCEDILAYLARAEQELNEIEFADEHLEKLTIKCKKAEEETRRSAEILRKSRQTTAQHLSDRILTELAQLDMPRVQFSCEFTETELGPNGADSVAFFMSANAGEAVKPLSKVASGGELARIMLAMKNVLAERDQVNTLIFDEVDTGVSGRAAQKVAEKLRSVASHKQVLCVTHLPQLAALAQVHLLIAKEERNGRTYTTVTPLDRQGRMRELARIIGGTNITEATLKSAEEMLC